MKSTTPLILLAAVIFVGATSCGDDSKKDEEIAALKAQLQAQANGQGRATVVINQVTTAHVTSYVQQTLTNVNSSTTTSNGVTVVYTVTNTGSSTSTGTAPRE